MGISMSGDDLDDSKSETNESVIQSESNNANTSLNTLKNNLALGGSQGKNLTYASLLISLLC